MYSYNFLMNIRITYEELCIKFSSILIGLKKLNRNFKNIFSENLKISVVYKYLKKVKIFLKYKSCKENASLINW